MSVLRIIVTGSIAQHLLSGMTWHHVQYVLGLARLGHDVYYIEDTGKDSYDPRARTVVENCDSNVAYLARVMSRFGLADRWAYCHLHRQWFGLSERKRATAIDSADLLLNVSGMLGRPEAYPNIPRLAYIDTDPVFNQAKLARDDSRFRQLVNAHDAHFSFGERLTRALPATGYDWRPTRQPIVLSEWSATPAQTDVFSTIMNWSATSKTTRYRDRTYGQKDVELLRFLDLPKLVAPTVLKIALDPGTKTQAPLDLLSSKGWRLVDPQKACSGLDSYRSYIESSMAEWSVAKNGYVCAKPGWFSDRSACYLAAGRPVVVQDTGFSSVLPTGKGIVSFATLEEAAAGINDVRAHYERHSDAARTIASEYFDARKVLPRLVDEALG